MLCHKGGAARLHVVFSGCPTYRVQLESQAALSAPTERLTFAREVKAVTQSGQDKHTDPTKPTIHFGLYCYYTGDPIVTNSPSVTTLQDCYCIRISPKNDHGLPPSDPQTTPSLLCPAHATLQVPISLRRAAVAARPLFLPVATRCVAAVPGGSLTPRRCGAAAPRSGCPTSGGTPAPGPAPAGV
jgi:hypothetical protein